MKKLKYLLFVCVFAIITTGCVKFNANMDIKANKSMEFSILYAFDKSMMGEDNLLKEEDMEEVKKQGFTVEKYSEGNYEGFKVSKKIANIDEVSSEEDVIYDLSGMMEEKEGNKYIFKVVKGADKNTYIAKLKFDSNDSNMSTGMDDNETEEFDDTEEFDEIETPDLTEDYNELELPDEEDDELSITSDGNDMDLSALMSNLDLTFSVNLPYSAVSSNATTKENDNKKLVWKLNADGEQLIEFTFELPHNAGSNNMLLYIGIGVAALVVVAVVILLLTKKKNNTPTVGAINNEPTNEVKEIPSNIDQGPVNIEPKE